MKKEREKNIVSARADLKVNANLNNNSGLPFSSATITLYLHATEDLDKVTGALRAILNLQSAKYSESKLEGYYGNPITLVVFELKGEEAASFAAELFAKLRSEDRLMLAGSLDRYEDESGALYLRLDKQILLGGALVLGEGDVVRVKLKSRLKGGLLTAHMKGYLASQYGAGDD